MKILVSNDDGVYSEGIHILADVLKKIGDVYIIAPDRERSAASHSLTLHKPLRINEIGANIYSINGTPTDCICLGINKLLDEKPALVVSGINKGGNMGEDVTYSGTVSAAIEGALLGIPSFAISQVGNGNYHFRTASHFAYMMARMIIDNGFPKNKLLNVNIPNISLKKVKGMEITGLGKRVYNEDLVIEKEDPRGKKYYWIGGNRVIWEKINNCDYDAINRGMISVTPLQLDMTDYKMLQTLKRDWEMALSNEIQGV
ncbi:MAG: 5'/3'-nucleotidase SurE [Nitrospirota bacterium]